MEEVLDIKVAKRGTITLPKPLRDRYAIDEGDGLTLLDLGGVFVLSPKPSQVDELADRIGDTLRAQGETLESMLAILREERTRAFSERYPEAQDIS
jgi:bifunctional DNA-binding transcriptional regulator/antitoxin component of YhaV-PrlF toxin-antitoxin module